MLFLDTFLFFKKDGGICFFSFIFNNKSGDILNVCYCQKIILKDQQWTCLTNKYLSLHVESGKAQGKDEDDCVGKKRSLHYHLLLSSCWNQISAKLMTFAPASTVLCFYCWLENVSILKSCAHNQHYSIFSRFVENLRAHIWQRIQGLPIFQ